MISREAAVAVARLWLGTPYHHQAAVKGVGCDCLGLVRGVYAELLGRTPEEPPHYSPDWAEATSRETMIEAARRHLSEIAIADAGAGDVLLFRMCSGAVAKHAAILTGPDKMIHALEGVGVTEASLSPWWRRRVAAAFAWPHDE